MDYCVTVVDRSMEEKKHALAGLADNNNPALRRKMQSELFADEVKVSLPSGCEDERLIG